MGGAASVALDCHESQSIKVLLSNVLRLWAQALSAVGELPKSSSNGPTRNGTRVLSTT
jgi:hypothetical protein